MTVSSSRPSRSMAMTPFSLNMKDTQPVVPRLPPNLSKVVAHIGGGAVAVVGEGFHDHGHAAGAVAFVGDALIVVVVALAGGLLDDPLDVVVGHVGSLGLGNGVLAGLEFAAGSALPPSFTATASSRPILVKIFALAPSAFSFFRLMLFHFECPDMFQPPSV